MEGFEGYIGIHLWNGQLVKDVLYILLSVFLFCFAILFRTHFSEFVKTVKTAIFMKQRQSIFDDNAVKRNQFYHVFMNFQGLFLSSLALFVMGWNKGLSIPQTLPSIFLIIGGLLGVLIVFYALKQLSYFAIGCVFTSMEKYTLWKSNYNSIMEIWGVSLYFPVIWLIFVGKYVNLAFSLFILLYIISRFVLIYNMIRIFHLERYGLLYLSLYLCGQEILPLLFLYKGVIYLYNIVEIGILWH